MTCCPTRRCTGKTCLRFAALHYGGFSGELRRWALMKAILFSLCAAIFSPHAAASFGAKCELGGIVESVKVHSTKSDNPDKELSLVLRLNSISEFVRATRGQGHDAWCKNAFKSKLEAGKITVKLRLNDSHKPPNVGDSVVFVFTYYSSRDGIGSGWVRPLAEELQNCKSDLGGCS